MRFFLPELLVLLTPEAGILELESFLLRFSCLLCFFFSFQALLEVSAFPTGSRYKELFEFEAFSFWILGLDFLFLESLELQALSRLAYTSRDPW